MKVIDLGRADYHSALALQTRLVDALIAGSGEETLLLLEHEPVYTIGRTRDQSSLRPNLPHPVVVTNRGGQATFHGPGQLVGYPILDLNRRGKDLHRYLRFLEEFLIRLCAGHGIAASRQAGLTGVWIGSKKVASLGVGVTKWISMHGFALNVEPSSLSGFSHITPCGIAGVEMTCLANEAARPLTLTQISREAADLFPTLLAELLSSIKASEERFC